VVTYLGATAGADLPAGSPMTINPNGATNGVVGIILSLPTGMGFSPGLRELVKVSFQATTALSANSSLALTDSPVRREVADTNASPLTASYISGTISVNPRPALGIAQAKQNLTLTWPLWATNYALQQAAGPTLGSTVWTNLPASAAITNSAFSTTVPAGSSIEFYRLKKQ